MNNQLYNCIENINRSCIKPILKCNNYIKKRIDNNELHVTRTPFRFNERDTDFNESFMSNDIQYIIYNKINCEETLELNMFDILFVVKLYSTDDNKQTKNQTQNIKKSHLDKLVEALSITISMSQWSPCKLENRKVIVKLFDIDIPKKFIPYDKVITSKNVNTAYTIPCRFLEFVENDNLEVVIFRNEEWVKVLFHELMHAYSYDIDSTYYTKLNNKIINLFKIKCDFKVNEAYTEFWARILYSMLKTANKIRRSKLDSRSSISTNSRRESFKKLLFDEIEKQRAWSIFQATVVLTNTELFDNVINISKIRTNHTSKNKIINNPEKTAAFSYYVITGFLMTDYKNVMLWCLDNNNNDYDYEYQIPFEFNNTFSNVDGFFSLVKDIVKDYDIIELWKNEKESLRPNFNKYSTTARMTID